MSVCGACGHVAQHHNGDCEWRGCGCPGFVAGPQPDERHLVYLSDYERDNLRHALYAASGWGKVRSPLYVLNTGDWLNQVLMKVGGVYDEDPGGKPNYDHTLLAENANRFDGKGSSDVE
jgi:hypothetical protein